MEDNKIIFNSSSGISVWSDWFDLDDGKAFRLLYLKMYEELGGKIAYGEMKLFHTGVEKAMTAAETKYTGKINLFYDPSIDSGDGSQSSSSPILDIDFFIINRQLLYNELLLNFVCLPKSDRSPTAKDFLVKLNTIEYSDITQALKSLYPGKIDLRCQSDLNNNIPLLQNLESDYEFCKKLAYSFKKDCIFTFGFEGLMIKDLIGIDHRGNPEDNLDTVGELISGGEVTQIDPYIQRYNNLLYNESENPWSKGNYIDQFKYGSITTYHDSYAIVAKEYSELLNNYQRNQALMNSNLLTSFRLVAITYPNYKIGDIIKYKNITDSENNSAKATNFSRFLVKSNELFISTPESSEVDADGLNFSWTTKLLAVDNVYGTMPTSDPADRLDNE